MRWQKKEDSLEQSLQQSRSHDLGVFVRFRPTDDEAVVALINAGATPESSTNWTMEQKLSFGNGIPLFPLETAWNIEKLRPPIEACLGAYQRKVGNYELYKVNSYSESRGTPRDNVRKLCWSEDGSKLILLTARGELLKFDSATWKLLAAVPPEYRIKDITWSTRSLVVLHYNSNSSRDSDSAKPWVMIEPGPEQKSRFEEHRLLISRSRNAENSPRLSTGRRHGDGASGQ